MGNVAQSPLLSAGHFTELKRIFSEINLLKMTEEEVNFDLTAKKKKKKKKTPFELDGADQVENEETPVEEEVPKKEKKKVEFEEENNDNVDDIDLESFGTKKKKKKKRGEG